MKKKFTILFLSFTLFFSNYCWSQSTILWEKNYGGTDQFESIRKISKFFNHGYILTGGTSSNDYDFPTNHGGNEAALIKIDLNGNKIWAKNYGGNGDDVFISSIIDNHGNIYSVGMSENANGNVSNSYGSFDVWIVKTDSLGTIIWEKSYGGSNTDCGFEILFTPDSSLMVASVSSSTNGLVTDHIAFRDIWVLRVNSSNGALIWAKSFGGTDNDGYNVFTSTASHMKKSASMTTHGDSTFAIAAYSTSFGDSDGDYWLCVFDINGTIINSDTYGGNLTEIVSQVQATPDGGYVIIGSSRSNNGDVTGHHGSNTIYDGWIAKVDASLNLEWQKSIGGTGYEDFNDVLVVDEGYYAIGNAESTNGDCILNYGGYDFAVCFIDTTGILRWMKNFGSPSDDWPFSICESQAGNIIVGGFARTIGYDVTNNYGLYDWWAFEFSNVVDIEEKNILSNTILIHPNPTSDIIYVDTDEDNLVVCIYDISGHLIFNNSLMDKRISLRGFETGLYYLVILNQRDEKLYSHKIIKE